MKTLKMLILSLVLVSTVFHSRESKAAIGTIFGAPVIVTGGLVVAGGAVGIEAVTAVIDLVLTPKRGGECGTGCATGLMLLLTIPLAVLGLVILEGEQTMSFDELSPEEAAKLKITKKELQAYNQELDQVNQLAAYVDEELSRDGKATLQESAALWSEVRDAISPEAFSALVKVNTQLFKR